MPVIPALRKLKQEDPEFTVSLSYTTIVLKKKNGRAGTGNPSYSGGSQFKASPGK
jgi:hypothetical protein